MSDSKFYYRLFGQCSTCHDLCIVVPQEKSPVPTMKDVAAFAFSCGRCDNARDALRPKGPGVVTEILPPKVTPAVRTWLVVVLVVAVIVSTLVRWLAS